MTQGADGRPARRKSRGGPWSLPGQAGRGRENIQRIEHLALDSLVIGFSQDHMRDMHDQQCMKLEIEYTMDDSKVEVR